MSLLDLVVSGKQKEPRRCLVYGTNGIGKSTFASRAENPIFIKTEDGLNDIDTNSFPICASFDEVVSQIRTLINEDHEYKTVCLDSLDWLEKLIFTKVAADNQKDNISEIGFYAGYSMALDHWIKILDGLDALRSKGMSVILIAHSKIDKYEAPDQDGYDRFLPNLHKYAVPVICEWCDEVLFAKYVSFANKKKDEKKAKGVGTGERVMFCQERPAYTCKNRLEMPDQLAFNYANYKKYIDGDINNA